MAPHATPPAPPAESGDAARLEHIAEAIEGKHRVRERLVRALARASDPRRAPDARPFDPASEDLVEPTSGFGVEGNPLGEYLLNYELQRRPEAR
jgi:hypothetical protein